MKKQPKGFESYPLWMVLVYNLISLSVYFAGLYLLYLVRPWLALLFFIYILYLEVRTYKEGCVNCYYYGKVCVAGRGKIAKLFFKKGDPKNFCKRAVSFKDFIPHLLVSIIPIVAGIYLLIMDFRWFILVLTVWPVIVWFAGNPIIYGELACPNCKQCQICCPVAQYFIKKEKDKKQRKTI